MPFINKIGLNFNLVDKPNERKQHNKSTVRIGGIGILLGILPIFILSNFNLIEDQATAILMPIFFGSISMFFIGFFDDLYSISFLKRLFLQILVSSFCWNLGLKVEQIEIKWLIFDSGNYDIHPFLSYLITTIWIVGIINAFNWLDGLDGLAAGISLITAITIFLTGLSLNLNVELFLVVALAGAVFGFLMHNFYPAKIFMGDGGSYLIGSLIAFYSLYLYKTDLELGYGKVGFVSIILLLFVPIFDMLYVITSRILGGRLPFYPDRKHLHHRILRIGFNHKDTVLLCYLISLFFSFLLLGNIYPDLRFQFIFSSLIANIIFVNFHFSKFVLIYQKLFDRNKS